MLTFPDIQTVVGAGIKLLPDRIVSDYKIKPYETIGGQSTDNLWRTAGFYAHESRKGRLVLEALYFEVTETCVVRVFRERRLKIFYAKKVVATAEGLEQMAREAVPIFQSRLPAKPVQSDEPDMSAFGDMGHSLAHLLLPAPPPVRVSEVEQVR